MGLLRLIAALRRRREAFQRSSKDEVGVRWLILVGVATNHDVTYPPSAYPRHAFPNALIRAQLLSAALAMTPLK